MRTAGLGPCPLCGTPVFWRGLASHQRGRKCREKEKMLQLASKLKKAVAFQIALRGRGYRLVSSGMAGFLKVVRGLPRPRNVRLGSRGSEWYAPEWVPLVWDALHDGFHYTTSKSALEYPTLVRLHNMLGQHAFYSLAMRKAARSRRWRAALLSVKTLGNNSDVTQFLEDTLWGG